MFFGDNYDRDYEMAECMRMAMDAVNNPALWDLLDMEAMEEEQKEWELAEAMEAYYNSLS